MAAVASRAAIVAADPAQPSTPGAHRNQGARGASAEYLLFADDDVLVEPEFVASAIALLDASPDVSGVGGRIHERQWLNGKFVREIADLHRSGRGGDVEMLAAAWIARRSAFEAAGGFDPRCRRRRTWNCACAWRRRGRIVRSTRARPTTTACRGLARRDRRRWSSGLFAGQGLLLRQSGTPFFARHLARQRLFLAAVAYAALGAARGARPVPAGCSGVVRVLDARRARDVGVDGASQTKSRARRAVDPRVPPWARASCRVGEGRAVRIQAPSTTTCGRRAWA